MKNKKCSKCQTLMQQGRLINNGMVWTGSEKFFNIYEENIKGCEALPAYGVISYRCPQCESVELYTSEQEKA